MERSSEKPIRGVIRPDPTLNPSDGDRLAFQPTRCKLLEGNETVRMNNLDAFGGVLLVWQFVGDGGVNVDGTAVLVAPGIAVSAKHVVEPHLERLMSASSYSTAIGITKAGILIWTVRKVTLLGNLDLVILGLELRSDLPPDRIFRQASITTRLPKLGERLQVCGFRATKSERKQLADVASHGCQIEGALLVSAGEVTHRYPEGRDRVMLPWPVLEVDCPTWGGMSGGPVFDQHGLLVGLLCSSLSTEDGGGHSYVSLLWPALVAEFEAVWPQCSGLNGPLTLARLAQRGCEIDRVDAVAFTPGAADGSGTLVYQPWE